MPSPSWCRDRGRAEAAPLPEAPAANGLLPPRSVESESDQPLVAPLLWLLMVEGRWRRCAWRYGPPPFGLMMSSNEEPELAWHRLRMGRGPGLLPGPPYVVWGSLLFDLRRGLSSWLDRKSTRLNS